MPISEREARAVEDPRELVAAEVVDAEQVLRTTGPGSSRSIRASRFCSRGSYGASSGAKIATRTNDARRARSRRSRPGCGAAAATRRARARRRRARAASSRGFELGDRHQREPDPRVDERVRDVDEQVDEHEDDRDEEDPALEHRVVAVEDRLDEPQPMPGHAKTVSVSTAPESSRPVCRPMIVDDRQQRVPQDVPRVDDAAAAGPWRARCARSPRSGRRAPRRA